MGDICGEIIGMFQEEFPPGLSYHVRVSTKCLGVAWLECFEPGRNLSPLGARGPPGVAFRVVPPMGMLSTGSGEGCCLLGLGDCLSAGVGGAAGGGCYSMGEVLHGRVSGGNGGVCPNKMW